MALLVVARLLLLSLSATVVLSATCPTTTEGVSPQLLSICSSLDRVLSSEIAAGATNAVVAASFTPVPTTGTSTGVSPSSTTAVVRSTSSASTTRDSGSSSVTPGPVVGGGAGAGSSSTTAANASSGSASSPSPTGTAGLSNASSSNGNNHHYRNHVVIPAAVVGSVVGAALIALILFFCLRRRRNRNRNRGAYTEDEKSNVVGGGPNGVNGMNGGPYPTAAAGVGTGAGAGIAGAAGAAGYTNGTHKEMQAGPDPPSYQNGNGVHHPSYAPAAAAVGAGAAIGAAGYGASRHKEMESRSPAVPYMTEGSGDSNFDNGVVEPAHQRSPIGAISAAAVARGSGRATPTSPNGRSGRVTPTSPGGRSGATSPIQRRLSGGSFSGDQTPPWAAQPLKHFRRASREDNIGRDGLGPTAVLGAAAVPLAQQAQPPQEVEAEHAPTQAAESRGLASSGEEPEEYYGEEYGDEPPGLADIDEEASFDDSASFYTEARISQDDGGMRYAGSSGNPYIADELDTRDPAHQSGSWLESPRNSDLATAYNGYQAETSPSTTLTAYQVPTQTPISPTLISIPSGPPSGPRPGSYYDPEVISQPQELPASSSPPQQTQSQLGGPPNSLQARFLQQQQSQYPSDGRPASTASSGLWSGLTEESENWWNSGVPVAGAEPNPRSAARQLRVRTSDQPSLVGTGAVDSGTARVVEGPWRGASGNGSLSSQTALEGMARSGSGSGRVSRDGSLVRVDSTGPGGSRWSIRRKPVASDAEDVGIAR